MKNILQNYKNKNNKLKKLNRKKNYIKLINNKFCKILKVDENVIKNEKGKLMKRNQS
jgi:hypothetical protein